MVLTDVFTNLASGRTNLSDIAASTCENVSGITNNIKLSNSD